MSKQTEVLEQPVMHEQLKKFQFFTPEVIQDKPANADPQAPTLNDIDISEACSIGNKLFFSSVRKKIVYVYEQNSIQGSFQVYTDQIHFMKSTKETKDGLIITFGVDVDNNMKTSYIKFFDPNSTTDYTSLKPKKTILVNKLGQPLTNFICFSIAKDLSSMAFGMQDGSILFFKSKNLLTMDYKDNYIQADQESIRVVQLTRNENNLHLYFTTESNCFCYQNMQNRKRFNIPGGSLFDLTPKGTFIGAPKEDNQNIYEFDDFKKVNQWLMEGEKLELRFFKQHYLLLLMAPKLGEGKESGTDTSTQFIIFDLLNYYIAYQEKYQKIQRFIPAGDYVYLITLNQKGEKILIKLAEKENTYKIETFFKKNFFDVMYRFAKNQSSDKALLSEISRLHGDHLYEKHDFQNAIKQYINTAGHLEPSYVIGKFLDVSHVDYLIQYLAALHKEKLADKNHTALLLNCYVKQKQISKLEEFLKESSFESDLFDIETAIRECRALNYTDLAMKLAESRKQNEFYLRILIDDKKDYPKAIQYIRYKIDLDEKVKYLKEFGQQLMKYEPDQCLQVIQNLVQLSSIATNMRKRNDPTKSSDGGTSKNVQPEEIAVFNYFDLQENDIERLTSITFSKPDEFLHLFVVNNEYLENYLVFLIKQCKNLPNEKTIFHRFFEYYLEKYQQYYRANQDTIKYREQKDIELQKKEQVIMDLLEDQENEKKYDKNHLLVLFKMYNFTPGIIFLLKKLQMREELLNFYITLKDNDKIIQLCKENGEKESNLWIQALKYFSKPENSAEKRIEEVLNHISGLQSLSPLLILNILSKNKNVNFKLVKGYFINKLRDDRKQIEEEQKLVKEKMKKASETRAEYKKLKTQAKVFQSTRCATCDNPLTLPSLHFLCSHSYHENCLHMDKAVRECAKCAYDTNRLLEIKVQFDADVSNTQTFREKLYSSRDKFDVICEYLGRGPEQLQEI